MTEDRMIETNSKRGFVYVKYSGNCLQCGNLFYGTTLKNAFCSLKCAHTGINSGMWKGGKHVNKKGYVYVKSAGHPRAQRSSNSYVFEHILVMERHLDRYLLPSENVHHKNGIKDDNRIENLELWVSYQPSGQRVQDLVKWVVNTYKKEVESELQGISKLIIFV